MLLDVGWVPFVHAAGWLPLCEPTSTDLPPLSTSSDAAHSLGTFSPSQFDFLLHFLMVVDVVDVGGRMTSCGWMDGWMDGCTIVLASAVFGALFSLLSRQCSPHSEAHIHRHERISPVISRMVVAVVFFVWRGRAACLDASYTAMAFAAVSSLCFFFIIIWRSRSWRSMAFGDGRSSFTVGFRLTEQCCG